MSREEVVETEQSFRFLEFTKAPYWLRDPKLVVEKAQNESKKAEIFSLKIPFSM